jgi:hypothetical protein
MIIENTANNFLFIVIEGTSTWLEVGHDCWGLYIIFINLSCGLKQLVIKTTVPEMVMHSHAYHLKKRFADQISSGRPFGGIIGKGWFLPEYGS